MAEGKRKRKPLSAKELANLTPIKKGQVLNPRGANAHMPALLKRMTQEEMAAVGGMIIGSSPQALREVIKDPTSSALKVLFAKVMLKGLRDESLPDALFNRAIGKVPDQLAVSGMTGGPSIHVTIPSNGREAPKDVTPEGEKGEQ